MRKSLELLALLLLRGLHVILLQLAVERGLADPQHTRRGKLVSSGFAQRPQNRAPFQFLEGQYLILFRRAFRRWILQVRGQICHMKDGPRTESDGSLDSIFQFANVSRPIVSNQPPHGFFGDRAHGPLRVRKLFQKGSHQDWDITLTDTKRSEEQTSEL